MHRDRDVELLVDLHQLGVPAVAGAEVSKPATADLGEAIRVDREADDLGGVDLPELLRRLDPFHDRDVRDLVPEVAEVDRERRLRGAGDPDEDDVRLVEPRADAVVVLDGELHCLDAAKVRGIEWRR